MTLGYKPEISSETRKKRMEEIERQREYHKKVMDKQKAHDNGWEGRAADRYSMHDNTIKEHEQPHWKQD
jgi:hypothetical protein